MQNTPTGCGIDLYTILAFPKKVLPASRRVNNSLQRLDLDLNYRCFCFQPKRHPAQQVRLVCTQFFLYLSPCNLVRSICCLYLSIRKHTCPFASCTGPLQYVPWQPAPIHSTICTDPFTIKADPLPIGHPLWTHMNPQALVSHCVPDKTSYRWCSQSLGWVLLWNAASTDSKKIAMHMIKS